MTGIDSRERAFERVASEVFGSQGLRALFDSVPGYAFLKDRRNTLLRVNETMAHAVASTPTTMAGTDTAFWYPDHADQYYRDDLEVISSGVAKTGIVEEIRNSAGESRVFLTDKYPVHASCGRVEGLVAIARDVTVSRGRERQEKALDDLSLLKDQLGRSVHDLTNWLAVVLGNVDVAATSAATSAGDDDALASARDATEEATRLARGLMRVLRGKPRRFDAEVVDLNRVVLKAVGMMRPSMPRDVALTLRLEDQPCWIRGDAGTLLDAVLNLVRNACDAMPNGGSVFLRTCAWETTKTVGFVVRDTGCGISEDVLPHIFEPLFTTKADGFGVGLASTKETVRAHDGDLEVSSVPGEGTTFRVRLPRMRS